MAGYGSRDYGCDPDHGRDRYCYRDDRRKGRSDGERDRNRDGERDRFEGGHTQGRDYSHGYSHGDSARRFVPVCYNCAEPGHYKNQSPRLVGESSYGAGGQRGQSFSLSQHAKTGTRRSASEEPIITKELEELKSTLANVKAYIDAEQARKDEAKLAKKEKGLRRQEQREREQKEEEECQLKARRAKKKEEKKRSELEAREAMRKDLGMEIRKHVSGVAKEMKEVLLQSLLTKSKGKAQVLSPEASEELDDSDAEALSAQADCRHRPLKRSPGGVPPVRASCSKKKISATIGPAGKLKYVADNLRDLGQRTVEKLKQICRDEDVLFSGGKKMDAIMAITEKRAQLAYGSDDEDNVAEELERINSKLSRRMRNDSELISMSYDIKDTFSKLPHEEIIMVVDWVLDYHSRKGHKSIRVNTRGFALCLLSPLLFLYSFLSVLLTDISRETNEADQARMLLLITEAKQRSDAVAAAAKQKAEDAEKARLLAIEQQRQHDEATTKAADEERVQCREKIFSGEQALLTMAADWRAEAENGKMEETELGFIWCRIHLVPDSCMREVQKAVMKRVMVADDVFRYVVAANPAGVQEACKFGSRGVVLAREKPRVLTQTVNGREDAVVPEVVAGKRTGDVHGNGEAGFPWDRHRAQLAVGIAVAGLASSTNFVRVAIPSDIGNEVGPSESLLKCNSAIDSKMASELGVMVLAEKASPKTMVSWDTQ
ncbi:hypothetical protein CBR_g21075 [Chara braunii]|uniref:CCHC-type domain-containing protein n=1 Tax=Chara braunii TaxID=69332 RepID=A0A388L0K0_CHABU|nr:hypothetical protein CBR_g21075 [Chara braunii]|eukprot:GBG75830.1 hypothetical protein CBR_g21075 [Chara braunii]